LLDISEGSKPFALAYINQGFLATIEKVAEVKIDGNTYSCILKDLQFNKVTDLLTHVDFLELVGDKKIIATLPLKFTGSPAGVKAGGKLVTKMKSFKVKTLPKYLREFIEVDLTNLELNENVRVEDVKLENIEVLNSPRIPIASITMTRQLKQEEASTPKAAAPVAKAAPAAATKAAPAAKK
jgi:large subunit ribosomal protein L25